MASGGEMISIPAGCRAATGCYILRLSVGEEIRIAFGRFRGGAPIDLPAWDYVYVGSALGRSRAHPLARRLVRHATRTASRPPHPIRERLLDFLRAEGLVEGDSGGGMHLPGGAVPADAHLDALLPRAGKRHFWHIDYLLDHEAAELTGILMVRTERPLERAIAEILAAEPGLSIVAKGLGARDCPGQTHLFRMADGGTVWDRLCARLRPLILCPTDANRSRALSPEARRPGSCFCVARRLQ